MGDRNASRESHRYLHWWHLIALLALVAGVEGGKALLSGASVWGVLTALPQSLYVWCPILAGVAISIRRADVAATRAAMSIGIVITLLMLALDVAGSLGSAPPPQTSAFTTQGFTSMGTDQTGTGWVHVALDWLRGDLAGLEERVAPGEVYPVEHPRRRAGEALLDGSLVLLVFGILGLVLAAGRWIRSHVTFRRSEDERAAHLVVAWLLSPMAANLALRSAEKLRYSALFGEGPLWAILLPPLGVLAVGIAAWLWSANDHPRAEVGEMEEDRPDELPLE